MEPPLEMVLYVSAGSRACDRALRHVARVADRYDDTHLRLVTRDVGSEDAAARRDRVVFTPTLIVRDAASAIRFLGDAIESHRLVETFDAIPVRRRRRR
jgi:hypothetical protein